MKLFHKFRRQELTPVERLADYESEISYNQSIIENLSQSTQNYQSLYEIYSQRDHLKFKTLKQCRKAISSFNFDITFL